MVGRRAVSGEVEGEAEVEVGGGGLVDGAVLLWPLRRMGAEDDILFVELEV